MEYLISLINDIGYWGYLLLFIIIFLESFPFTFYLPGDSLLFTTGFLASQGHFNLGLLVLVLYLGGSSGYILSYHVGEKIRDFIINSNDRYWFKKKHLDYTKSFYDRYGMKTLIIGRFIPVVRSFSATLAGAVEMNYKKFVTYTVVGGFIWTFGVTSAGYYLGKLIPNVDLYLTPIILGIIFVSILPTVYEYFHQRRKKINDAK
jgi:membrane-associated protein